MAGIIVSGCGQETKLSTSSMKARRAYHEGVSLFEKFYFNEAMDAFRQSLAADSALAMAWARLAILDFTSENESGARDHVEKALLYSGNATRREQLFIRMWNHYIRFSRDKAMAVVDSLIREYPDEAEAYVFRGRLYEHEKSLEEAIRSYERALEIDTAYAPAAMSLGYAYSQAGEQEKALVHMERYIRLDPGSADPRASYADLLLYVGEYTAALDQYKRSLEVKPDYWYAHTKIGEIYTVYGRLREAEEELTQGKMGLPFSKIREATIVAEQAHLNTMRGRYTEAIRQFEAAFNVDSMNVSAAYGVVHALTKLEKFKEADRAVQRIRTELERRNLTSSRAMLGFYLMKARLFIEQDRLSEARAACDTALDFTTALTRGAVYKELAEIGLREKSFETAFDACEEALGTNPNNPEALLTLTKLYHATGDERMTQEIGGRLLALWSNADPDFEKLAELRRLVGPGRSPVL